ncbi:MAG: HYR domain-containing protein, partial [Crocinitomicaceae bacterium]|nr:HYR domain-containing protein [Crocinitomicaceae bacterium]
APTVFPTGLTWVTWTVTDASGNTATCSQKVKVKDKEDPTIVCPPKVVVFTDPGVCEATNVQLGMPVTGDNCQVVSVTNDAPTVFPTGLTWVTWTVTDASGNTATCSQKVKVKDKEDPVALCQDITVSLDAIGQVIITSGDIDAGSYDNCGLSCVHIDIDTLDCSNIGSNTVTLTAIDINGNTSICTATVTVVEGSFVELICPGDQLYDCSQSCGVSGAWVSWPDPTASSFTSCDNGCDQNTEICGFIYLGEFEGSRYYCSNTSNYTWDQANSAAIAAGGNLVSINSAAENQYVRNSIFADYVWIGLSDQNIEGMFEWSNGDALSYTNWAGNEPNNLGPGGNCCGAADYVALKGSSGYWYDRRACKKYEYVMEVPCGNPVTITQISGPQNGSVMAGNTSEVVTYVAVDDVTGVTDTCSFTVSVNECVPVYCTSSGSCTAYEWIDNVSLGTISNPSGNDGGYGDYTNLVHDAQPGDVIDLQLTPGFSGGVWQETWRVWVDWNYDGDFYDQGELVYQGYGYGAVNGSFTIPVYAESNDLRVRVSMRWNCYAGPCSDFTYGEVEDYILRVDNPFKSSIIAGNNVDDYSDVIEDVEVGGVGLELKSVYPDPVLSTDGLVTVELRSARDTDLSVKVVDLSGNVVKELVVDVQRGENSAPLNVRGLAKGTYILQVIGMDIKKSTKLIVQ